MRRVALTLAILGFMVPLTARADKPPVPESAPTIPARPPAPPVPPAPTKAESAEEAPPATPKYRAPHVVAYEGGRIPSNAHLEERTNMKLLTPGLWLAGTPYAVSLLYALGTCGAQMQCRNGSAALYVPIVGPFFTAAYAPTSGGAALSVFDGAVQTLGAVLFIAGIAMPKQVVVWQDEDVALRVAPAPIANGAGLVLSLTHL